MNTPKYIGILLVHQYSTSLRGRKKVIHDKTKKSNYIKLNTTRLLLKGENQFYTIDYDPSDDKDIVKTVLGIKKKYMKKCYRYPKGEYRILIVLLNTLIQLSETSEYKWRSYLDCFEHEETKCNYLYKNILKMQATHLEHNLCSDNDPDYPVLQLKEIYKCLCKSKKYSVLICQDSDSYKDI